MAFKREAGLPLLDWTRGGQLEAAGVHIGDGMELVRTICERFPNRTAGSPGERGQAEYLADVFAEAGLQDVALDPVPCIGTDFDHVELRYPDAGGAAIEAMPIVFSGSTASGGCTAPLRYYDSEDLIDFRKDDLAGKILLVYGGFGEYKTTAYYQQAVAAGVAGVIVVRDREYAICMAMPASLAACGNLPVVGVSHTGGMDLVKSGATTAYLHVQTRTEDVTGYNVVGRLPANRDLIDDQVLLVTAHLDGKPVKPSAADNGTGTAMAVEVMLALARAERRREVWFAGYTAEEIGFGGTSHFPLDHPEVAERCVLQLYYDGHGTIVGRNKLEITGDDGLAAFITEVAADIGHAMETHRRLIGLDPVILCARGVPAIRVARSPQRTWHSDHDTVDDVGPQAMRGGIHLYAEAAYRLVNAPKLPFERWVSEADREKAQERVDRWVPTTIEAARQGLADLAAGQKQE